MDLDQRPLRLVITGVESSGKTTMAQAISRHFGFPLALEAARYDHRIRSGEVEPKDLERILQLQFQAALEAEKEAIQSGAAGMVSDTGGLVLELWGQTLFGHPPRDSAKFQCWFDLYILCPPDIPWEPDPLRSLPRFDDRISLHHLYQKRLQDEGYDCAEVRGSSHEERLLSIIPAIDGASSRCLNG